MLYEKNALAVYGIDQVLGVFQVPAQILDATQLFRAGSVEKDVESVIALAQEIGRAAPDDHAVALLGDVAHYFFPDLNHAVGTEWLVREVGAAFVAAPPEDFY